MRVAVLCASDSWYFRDLRRAAGSADEVIPLSFESLVAGVGWPPDADAAGVSPLQGCAAVLVRTMPPGSLEQVVFRMDALGRAAAAGQLIVNSPRAVETAVDKYLTLALVAEAGVPVPRTLVCQNAAQAWEAWERLGRDVVVKPLFGSEGRGLLRVREEAMAERVFKTVARLDAVLYLQEFVAHRGFDFRLLVIGERLFSIRRRNPLDWRTNVSQGGVAEAWTPDESLRAMAVAAAAAVGAEIAGVDILPAVDGRHVVLEVNAVPGWKALAAAVKQDIAAEVLGHLRQRLASPRSAG